LQFALETRHVPASKPLCAISFPHGPLAGKKHLAALNRGILLTPFHNMALISPATTAEDIDYHTRVFRESVEALLG